MLRNWEHRKQKKVISCSVGNQSEGRSLRSRPQPISDLNALMRYGRRGTCENVWIAWSFIEEPVNTDRQGEMKRERWTLRVSSPWCYSLYKSAFLKSSNYLFTSHKNVKIKKTRKMTLVGWVATCWIQPQRRRKSAAYIWQFMIKESSFLSRENLLHSISHFSKLMTVSCYSLCSAGFYPPIASEACNPISKVDYVQGAHWLHGL